MDTSSLRADPRSNIREQVLDIGRRLSSHQWRLVHLVAELDRSGEWLLDGAATCAHWVAAALDVEVCTAREWLRVGAALLQQGPHHHPRRRRRERRRALRSGRAHPCRTPRPRDRRVARASRGPGRDRAPPAPSSVAPVVARHRRHGDGVVPPPAGDGSCAHRAARQVGSHLPAEGRDVDAPW